MVLTDFVHDMSGHRTKHRFDKHVNKCQPEWRKSTDSDCAPAGTDRCVGEVGATDQILESMRKRRRIEVTHHEDAAIDDRGCAFDDQCKDFDLKPPA